MSRKEKPLPSPNSPGSRFKEEERTSGPLIADQMAMAAATGNIEQFMAEALPDSEHARKLATMMMGMTGMMPPQRPEASPAAGQSQAQSQAVSGAADERAPQETPETPPPDEVFEAVRNADVKGLMGLLQQEHAKRSGEGVAGSGADARPQQAVPAQQMPPQQTCPPQPPTASIEKILIDRVMAVAVEHDLTPDWVVMRALKLYVEEYEKTGRL